MEDGEDINGTIMAEIGAKTDAVLGHFDDKIT